MQGAEAGMQGRIEKHIGARIRLRRVQLGLDRKDVARALEVEPAYLDRIERGAVRITAHSLDKLCDLLAVTPSYFFTALALEAGLTQSEGSAVGGSPDPEAVLARAAGAAAKVNQIGFAQFGSFSHLPLMVMEGRRLVQKHARAAGLGDVAVTYHRMTTAPMITEGLFAGRVQFVGTGMAPFLIAWDRTRHNLGVKALSALNRMTYYLVARNPRVRSIEDFAETDRITVVTPGAATPAILLKMAAAQAFGTARCAQFDKLTLGMSNIDAAVALISGSGPNTADFNNPPFSYRELDTPGVRLLLTSDQLLGPVTDCMLYTTTPFAEENPRVVAAVTAALDEAMAVIRADRREAAEIFREITTSQYKVALGRMVDDPRFVFDRNPHGLMKYARFMHQIGSLKTEPGSWRDVFFPEAAATLDGD